MSLPIAIAGANGRMGRALVAACANTPGLKIVGASVRANTQGPALPGAIISTDPSTAMQNAEVWIDFTTPEATLAALRAPHPESLKSIIIGTTGFTPAQETEIAAAAQTIAIVRSGNFSLGVNLLAALAEQAAARLGKDWDIEILETHHRHKKDAPSGTALLLGEAVATGRGEPLADVRSAPYETTPGPRREGAIGFAARRAGSIVGEHEVLFASNTEILRLSHQALDRAVFADGALAAARWAANKRAGLYSMRDVLGL